MNPSDVRAQVSSAEWQARVDLAACYRLVALYGWDDLVFTHISARVPGEPGHFLINPYGMMFEEITASSLVKVNAAGEKVTQSPFPVNPAGFIIHSAIHGAREDAHWVLHVHTASGVAVSAQKDGLLPLSQVSLFPLASLAYHDYEGVALNEGEKARLVKDFGDKLFLILRNHGTLTVGRTAADAFLYMYLLEQACRTQLLAQGAGKELISVPKPIVDGIRAQAAAVTKDLGGALAWPGLLRRLDRVSPGYKD